MSQSAVVPITQTNESLIAVWTGQELCPVSVPTALDLIDVKNGTELCDGQILFSTVFSH